VPESNEKLQRLLQQLETERDELRLKLGLAKLEARDEWQEVEKKMESLRGRLRVAGGEAREASGEVASAARSLADEIKEGFARVRKLL
jgi:ribosomal protein L12E/L44/L45/RPP1/RPP2